MNIQVHPLLRDLRWLGTIAGTDVRLKDLLPSGVPPPTAARSYQELHETLEVRPPQRDRLLSPPSPEYGRPDLTPDAKVAVQKWAKDHPECHPNLTEVIRIADARARHDAAMAIRSERIEKGEIEPDLPRIYGVFIWGPRAGQDVGPWFRDFDSIPFASRLIADDGHLMGIYVREQETGDYRWEPPEAWTTIVEAFEAYQRTLTLN